MSGVTGIFDTVKANAMSDANQSISDAEYRAALAEQGMTLDKIEEAVAYRKDIQKNGLGIAGSGFTVLDGFDMSWDVNLPSYFGTGVIPGWNSIDKKSDSPSPKKDEWSMTSIIGLAVIAVLVIMLIIYIFKKVGKQKSKK